MEKEQKNLIVYFILIILIFWTVVRKSALETDEALDEKVLLVLLGPYLVLTVSLLFPYWVLTGSLLGP